MKITITRLTGYLKRELWEFDFTTDQTMRIYFDAFFFQTKESSRHKWRTQSHWQRLDKRSNNIDCPNPPQDVIEQAKQELINTLCGINHIIT